MRGRLPRTKQQLEQQLKQQIEQQLKQQLKQEQPDQLGGGSGPRRSAPHPKATEAKLRNAWNDLDPASAMGVQPAGLLLQPPLLCSMPTGARSNLPASQVGSNALRVARLDHSETTGELQLKRAWRALDPACSGFLSLQAFGEFMRMAVLRPPHPRPTLPVRPRPFVRALICSSAPLR